MLKKRASGEMEGDIRLIGNRDDVIIEVSHFNMTRENIEEIGSKDTTTTTTTEYAKQLSTSLFGHKMKNGIENERILSLRKKPPNPLVEYHQELRERYASSPFKAKPIRHISTKEFRILEAPGIIDDFYSTLIDWSRSNMIACALGSTLYYWKADSTTPELLFELEENHITAVSWCKDEAHYITVGTKEGALHVWDIERKMQVRKLTEHTERIGCIDWSASLMSSGSLDQSIKIYDVRLPSACIETLSGYHHAEVIGLKWNKDGSQLASGSSDNRLCIWNSQKSDEKPLELVGHTSTIKALAWCPWQSNLLATGSGIDDETIKFWNTHNGTMLDSLDSVGQVSSLLWCRRSRELISSHGYTDPRIVVRRYPSLDCVVELGKQEKRILSIVTSPDEKTLLSLCADKTLRFWSIAGGPDSDNEASQSSTPVIRRQILNIR